MKLGKYLSNMQFTYRQYRLGKKSDRRINAQMIEAMEALGVDWGFNKRQAAAVEVEDKLMDNVTLLAEWKNSHGHFKILPENALTSFVNQV